jgi:hypothetical protein
LRGEYLNDKNGFLCNSLQQNIWISGGLGMCDAAFAAARRQDLGFENPDSVGFTSGTATIEVAPVDHLLLRLDGRIDHASENVFPKLHSSLVPGSNTWVPNQGTITLGVVATTD